MGAVVQLLTSGHNDRYESLLIDFEHRRLLDPDSGSESFSDVCYKHNPDTGLGYKA